MRRRGADPHGDLTQLQCAEPMHAQRVADSKAFARFGDDAFALAHRQRHEGLVFQSSDALALVVIAHPALEGRKSAAAGSASSARRACVSSALLLKRNAVHPPATGGRNTTLSPSASVCDQSANSSLMATRSCSGRSFSPRAVAQFLVELARIARAGVHGFAAAAGLFTQQRESTALGPPRGCRARPLARAAASCAALYSAAVLTLSSARGVRSVSSATSACARKSARALLARTRPRPRWRPGWRAHRSRTAVPACRHGCCETRSPGAVDRAPQ